MKRADKAALVIALCRDAVQLGIARAALEQIETSNVDLDTINEQLQAEEEDLMQQIAQLSIELEST